MVNECEDPGRFVAFRELMNDDDGKLRLKTFIFLSQTNGIGHRSCFVQALLAFYDMFYWNDLNLKGN